MITKQQADIFLTYLYPAALGVLDEINYSEKELKDALDTAARVVWLIAQDATLYKSHTWGKLPPPTQ